MLPEYDISTANSVCWRRKRRHRPGYHSWQQTLDLQYPAVRWHATENRCSNAGRVRDHEVCIPATREHRAPHVPSRTSSPVTEGPSGRRPTDRPSVDEHIATRRPSSIRLFRSMYWSETQRQSWSPPINARPRHITPRSWAVHVRPSTTANILTAWTARDILLDSLAYIYRTI